MSASGGGDLLRASREVETCRICRGEGSPEEPLYHPCKCSGSIKYVHQDCLMEWLQHSQRKHSCELCKTPFKFTKLYAPDMPSHIPRMLFMMKIISHIRSSVVLYLRLMLVCFVWLGWLPLSTRYALRFYFWVSDEMFDIRNQNTTAFAGNETVAVEATQSVDLISEIDTASVAATNMTLKTAMFGELTSNPVVKILVDTFEGQVITGLVVLVFVVIFLIREWVLQNAALNREQDIPAFIEHLEEDRRQDIARIQPPVNVGAVQADQQPAAPLHEDGGPAYIPPELLEFRREPFHAQVFQNTETVFDLDIADGVAEFVPELGLMPGTGPEPEQQFRNVNAIVEDLPVYAAGPANAEPANAQGNPLEGEHVENNGFWDVLGAWFRDNILGEEDAEADGNDLVARDGFNDGEVQRNADDEPDEDGDDFDGIMELIGMRGPIPVLFQNGIFSTVLVTGTLAVSLWIPYLLGKIVLLVASHPITFFGVLPIRFISFWVNQAIDIAIFIGAYAFSFIDFILGYRDQLRSLLHKLVPAMASHPATQLRTEALFRIVDRFHKAEDFFTGALSPQSMSSVLSKPIWIKLVHGGALPDKVSTVDRTLAVVAGYVMFTALGAWYLSRWKRSPRHRVGRTIERIFVDILKQAGAIMKVIVIIGIELAIFPLFCGVLLDLSLMPLFDGVTIQSRWEFSLKHPLPSTFLHWFVGTCYMFHFALFVSLCREIVRPGVLYFIRDPNDPNFHPIRDVLDRHVWVQLRKIALSAVIYCSLICICLGGVVYTLRYGIGCGVLPINWAWGDTIMEFPIDLLLYHVFMPFVLRVFKPSGLLNKSWKCFFRKASSVLRLTSFMFNEEVLEEEGTFYYKHWGDRFRFLFRSPSSFTIMQSLAEFEQSSDEVAFIRDGSFVRAPNSDSVHLRRERYEFVLVTKGNSRLDGKIDNEEDLKDIVVVYLPPHFRLRIAFLLLGIWLFAASCGLSATVGPLLLGRKIFSLLLPTGEKMNDIYCLTVGGYVFCLIFIMAKFIIDNRATIERGYRTLKSVMANPRQLVSETTRLLSQVLKVAYVSLFFAFVIPALLALLMEFYIVIPLHLYFTADQPVIHLMQGWALGVLYSKLLWKVFTLDAESKWARAYRQVFALGYLKPNIVVATKALVLPIAGTMTAMLLAPVPLGWIAEHTILRNSSQELVISVYRFSYPIVLAIALSGVLGYGIVRLWKLWNTKLRDEVYLIGEQLHNHGD